MKPRFTFAGPLALAAMLALAPFGRSVARSQDSQEPVTQLPVATQQEYEVKVTQLNEVGLAAGAESSSWFGVEVTPASDALRAQLGLAAGQGLVVSTVQADSPAAEAGIEVHDVLVSFADATLTDAASLEALVKEYADKTVTISFVRAGKALKLDAKPKSLHFKLNLVLDRSAPVSVGLMDQPKYWIGVETGSVDETLRAQLKLPADRGVAIVRVIDDTPAAKANVQPHDVLLTINNEPVANVDDLPAKVQALAGNAGKFQIVRAGEVQVLEIAPILREQQVSPNLNEARFERYTDLGEVGAVSRWLYPGLVLDRGARFEATQPNAVLGYYHALSSQANTNCTACHKMPESCQALSGLLWTYHAQRGQPVAPSPPTELGQIQNKLLELQQAAERQAQVLREVTEGLGKLEQKLSAAAADDERQKSMEQTLLRVNELLEQLKGQGANGEKK